MAANSNVVASLLAEIDPEILKNFMASHDDYLCPITREVMQDPVVIASGETFERESITQWLNGHNTCPTTNIVLPNKNLIENKSLRRAIISNLETLKKENPLQHNAQSTCSSVPNSVKNRYPIVDNLEFRISQNGIQGLPPYSIKLWDTSKDVPVPQCGMSVTKNEIEEMIVCLESKDVGEIVKYCRLLGSTANLIADNIQSALNISQGLPAMPIRRSYGGVTSALSISRSYAAGAPEFFSRLNGFYNFPSSASSSEKPNDDVRHPRPG
ncbi:MAG: hypothetical protein K0R48_413 [Gammaproteobacteria bacterium]|jgi:hypothetical protein|nr:hypothetical protein [Gammaproteobacteria bacterium]